MSLDRRVLTRAFQGLDDETHAPLYSEGMLLPNLNADTIPGQYHEPIADSAASCEFLASLCLYFINNESKEDLFIFRHRESGLVLHKNDLIFLDHFIFRHIPEQDFRAAIARESNPEDKVKAICTLIHEKIRIPSGFSFYDLFETFTSSIDSIDAYQSDEKKKICCKCLMPLAQAKTRADVTKLRPTHGGWEIFVQSCEAYGIDLSVEADEHKNESPTHPQSLLVNPPLALGESVLDIAGLIASVNEAFTEVKDEHPIHQEALLVKDAFEAYANDRRVESLESLNQALGVYQDAIERQKSSASAQSLRRFLQAVCIATVVIATGVGIAYLAGMPLLAAIGIGLAIVGLGAALGYEMKTRSRADTVINTARFFSQRVQTDQKQIVVGNDRINRMS